MSESSAVSANNRRIAKNTLALYLRMALSMCVSLYTSRVVLETLGVTDFGIYNIVGGVVGLLGFLNASLSGATSRFLTFELGRGNDEALRRVFSGALLIHFFIACIVLVFAETVGIRLLETTLVIPPERLPAARIVLQFSIFSAMVSITQVPYTASILAHERMSVYACVSVVEVFLRLGIVFLLTLLPFDKLSLYALLTFSVSTGTALFYRFFCRRNFQECRFRRGFRAGTLLPLLSFSAWDLFGNLSVVARTQGVNVLQNLFFGPAVNAAAGVAGQVQGAVSGFAENFLNAVRPQIVKYYACGEIAEMQTLICRSGKFSFFLMFFISLPLILECEFVLNLWLKNVPDYAVAFVQLTLVNQLVSIAFRTMMFSIHATGRIRAMSLINGATYLLVLPLSWILLRNGFSPITPFVLNIALLTIGCLSTTNLVRLNIPQFSAGTFLREVILRGGIFAAVAAAFPLWLSLQLGQNIGGFFAVGFASVGACAVAAPLILFNARERAVLFEKIRQFRKKIYGRKN